MFVFTCKGQYVCVHLLMSTFVCLPVRVKIHVLLSVDDGVSVRWRVVTPEVAAGRLNEVDLVL